MTFSEAFYKMEELSNCKKMTRYRYNKMISIYTTYEDMKKFWAWCPEEFCLKDRFKRVSAEKPKRDFPSDEGLYLIGQTTFNPFTNEKFYWLKVGKASDFTKRMKTYSTHNPCIWKIDFMPLDKNTAFVMEISYSSRLKNLMGLETGEHSKEWFRVNENDYLDICNKGFKHEIFN